MNEVTYKQYYRCISKSGCKKNGRIRYFDSVGIDNIVWSRVSEILTSAPLSQRILELLERNSNDDNGDIDTKIVSLQRELKGLDQETDRTISIFRKGVITEDQLEKQLNSIKTSRATLSNQLEKLQNAKEISKKIAKNNKREVLKMLREKLSALQPTQKQYICNLLVHKLILGHDGDIQLELNLANN